MNEWELSDEELNTAVTSGAAQYKHERDTAIAWGDEEYYEHCAIARAAQKKLVEWLNERCMEHLHDASIARVERSDCAECWAMIEAALGVKDED